MVSPHLEYSNSLKRLELSEAVQYWTTKMVPGLHDLRYEERLRHMVLPSLLYRQLHGNVIETYK